MEEITNKSVGETATQSQEETTESTVDEEYTNTNTMGGKAEVPKVESEEIVEGEDSTNPSDYDSADTYSEGEGEHVPHSRSDHSGSDGEQSVALEREEGDGQESVPQRKIDDDEDKKNPQYIPKRGTFYEHDDRTAEDNEDDLEEKKEDKDSKKKIWTDKKEKWNHDKFNDNDQAPKSRAELVSIYGYDIRNEDGPPRARRRRRYGRGPNKYTRNWEDEDAYNKPPLVIKKTAKKPGRNNDDESGSQTDPQDSGSIDEANSSGRQSVENKPEIRSHRKPSESNNVRNKDLPPPPPRTNEHQPRGNDHHPRANDQNPRANDHHQRPNDHPQRPNDHQQRPNDHQQRPNDHQQRANDHQQRANDYHQRVNDHQQTDKQNNKNQRIGTGRIQKPSREIKDSDYKGFTKPRQFAAKAPKEVSREKEQIQSQNFVNRRSQELEKDMSRLHMQEQQGQHSKPSGKHSGNRQGTVPPRMQGGEQKGSKRYSSIRQRSVPETVPPSFNQHTYYNAEYNQNQVSSSQPQQIHPLQTVPIHPNPAQMPAIPPPPLPTIPQVPVTSTPLPPQYAGPFPQAPFMQPAPPPFLPPQPPPIINYVQGQPQFAPPPVPYQGYQQPFNPVTQATEIYQPPGGITYYSPQDQQAAQRAALQKRPKAAIPIVPPPPLEPRGRGRSINNQEMSPNSTDVVIENMVEHGNTYEVAAAEQ